MKVINLNPGGLVSFEGKNFLITANVGLEQVICRDPDTGTSQTLNIGNLQAPILKEKPRQENTRPELDPQSIEYQELVGEAKKKLEIIEPLLGYRTLEMVKKAAAAAKVSVATIYNWIAAYVAAPQLSSLFVHKPNGGRGKFRTNDAVLAVIDAVIQLMLKKQEKVTNEDICDEVISACKTNHLKPPTRETIRSRIRYIKQSKVKKPRLPKYLPLPDIYRGADVPLAIIQIDHTVVDLMVVDDIYRKSIGRPWITLAIDIYSRMIVGYFISLDPPGNASLGPCLAQAFLPKEKFLAELRVSTSWPVWGKMRKIHCDNAGEFRGNMFRNSCTEYGMDLEFRKVKQPDYGAHIESLIGKFMNKIHRLRGTTFSNPQQRGEYDSDKNAVMTLNEFEQWFAWFVTGIYHNRKHSALGMSPLQKLEEGILGTKDTPGRPRVRLTDETSIRRSFLPSFERTIQDYWMVFDGIYYYADVLRPFKNQKEPKTNRHRKFIFRYNPRNMKYIYFYHPEQKKYFEVSYRNGSFPPISIWELNDARATLRKRGKNDPSEIEIFRVIKELRRLEEGAAAESKKARRQVQRRKEHEKHNEQYYPPEKVPGDVVTTPPVTSPSVQITAEKPVIVTSIQDSEEEILTPRVIRKLRVERT